MATAGSLIGVACASAILSTVLRCGAARADDGETVRGPDKLACIAADTDGQALRRKGALRAARRRFAGCSADSCPQIVRDDCFERIRELTKAQPWVIFDATNGRGGVLHEVKVFMDNGLLTERLDGRPIGVEPGEHTFTFRALGRFGDELKLSLREGAWERHPVVLKTFAPGLVVEADAPVAAAEDPPPAQSAEPAAVAVHVAPTEAPRPPPESATSPALFDPNTSRGRLEITAAAVGATGIVLGSVLGALTFSTWSTANGDCSRGCANGSEPRALASEASTEGVISTVSFVTAGAALAAGAVLWLTDRPSARDAGVSVVPSVGPRLGQITVQSRF
jgi:hypothetical protein